MGLFDTVLKPSQPTVVYTPQSEAEAWIAIMFSCMAVDDDISNAETEKLSQIMVYKALFRNHDTVELYKTAMTRQLQLGSKELIDRSVDKVSAENKPTLFALIVELLLADGILADKEKEITDYLVSALDLDESLATKIIEVILIKNKGNFILQSKA
ncbi:TerB family tellurite resistance protein [Adhaeribacter swui]|uniref:TerB family tellurite resistance protein n=1 Tax=Adhaeribacter swui TaxID=2086471 RepID=A0A7G7G364_9BACT|nr:TerB family tellurite resistance protein [Adhaeribacter swui]QNF31598.1 TerB family tellurite resistance protein [Adhaeribacter swui]